MYQHTKVMIRSRTTTADKVSVIQVQSLLSPILLKTRKIKEPVYLRKCPQLAFAKETSKKDAFSQ